MARLALNPTDALPFIATWAAPDSDLLATDGDAPLELPVSLLDGDFIVVVAGAVGAGETAEWQLVVTDAVANTGTPIGPTVFAVLAGISSDPPTPRLQAMDNADGNHVHAPLHFDVRGISGAHAGGRRQLFLAFVAETGAGNKLVYSVQSYTVGN